jgi:hypothetical protein
MADNGILAEVSNVYLNAGRVTIRPQCLDCSHPRSLRYAILCPDFLAKDRSMSQPPTPTGQLQQSQPWPPPIYRAPRPKQFGWLAMIIAVVGAFGFGAGVVAVGSADTTGAQAATPALTGESNAEPAGFTPKKSDFEIGIKILEKQCFGSGGCSIAYRIKPKYVGTQELPDDGTIEVSYRVTGDEFGPRQNTFQIVDGQTKVDKDEFAGTPSSGTVLKAKVIEVSYTKN